MQKQIIAPPSKFFMAPLFTMEIMGQPLRKACKLNFTGKFVVFYFKAPPLQGSKN